MSKFSGKCDLYDHIMMEKTEPLYPNNKNSPLVGDEKECFEIFKRRTNGVIYQKRKLKLTELNIESEIKKHEEQDNNSYFSRIEHHKIIKDRRYKTKEREIVEYTYKIWNKEYANLDEINKDGYYTTIEIKFEDILDLIPFYPYVISVCASDKESEYIVISNESEVDFKETVKLEYGGDHSSIYHYRHELQQHYLEIIRKYYDKGKI